MENVDATPLLLKTSKIMPLIRISFISIIFFAVAIFRPIDVHAIGMAKVTVTVVDEDGNPIDAALVKIRFQGGTLDKDAVTGLTDNKGVFSVSGFSADGVVGGGVRKTGYYKSALHHDFHRNILGMWQPWDKEIKVVLRPKINPVPMYVGNKWVQIPAIDKEIGFDLMKFDWVTPYGQGTTADFIFLVTRRFKDMNDFDATLTMRFSNPYDGIQEIMTDRGGDFNVGSEFRLPRYAPESGYRAKLVKRLSRSDPDFFALKETITNYLFRVRSEVDEKGNVKRAMYGKIINDVKIDPRGNTTGDIRFTYYLNPDYTRNLEYDPKANLFSPLPKGETSLELP